MQFFIFALVLLATEIFFLDYSKPSFWMLFGPTLLAFAYQLWWILPYTSLYPKEVQQIDQVDTENSIKIITANVLMSNKHVEKLISLVEQNKPDILVTLETNQWWQSKLKNIEDDYPYRMSCPLENLYGMHIYSKYVLSDSKTEFLVEDDIPSMHTLLTLPSGQNIRMHFLHPAPPSPTENEESSERDAELIMVAKSVAGAETPVIVTGDLNDVAWSKTTRLFRKISKLLDPRIGRGMFNTFHADFWFMRWPLDHLFHSPHFKLYAMRRLSPFGSDHFALLTQLIYNKSYIDALQSGLTADKDDQAFAKEKLSTERVSENDVPSPG
ncbi:endonuclease/exonuclease/phosphatase family protein [Methylophaga sp. UBA1464]|jgi:endonuclease/exonuclease/phosphatase (EEP) superfamily protein YafD|nr:endonuclease/exonuclease/phosphatase family protein [Methylophaga sp. UBA1464]|tara:strand:+ start:26830 stop:27807 length:978 start_codon:yes stop_codon:yes gene_type:complete